MNETKEDIKSLPLDVRMTNYANSGLCIVPRDSYYIVRLDGNNFKRFTKQFTKPFDTVFIQAMKNTQIDMHMKFNPTLSYSHSDEISLVFNKVENMQTHFHNGRVSKIVSIMASYCSVRFAYHISTLTNKNIYDQMFDARVVMIDESYELANYFIWRSLRDCERNAVSTYARMYYTDKELKYVWKEQMINMLARKDLIWNEVPMYIRHGIYCKINLVEMEKDGKPFYRKEYVCKNLHIDCSLENIDMILAKYWNNAQYGNEYNVLVHDV